jgi:hypothetical protein
MLCNIPEQQKTQVLPSTVILTHRSSGMRCCVAKLLVHNILKKHGALTFKVHTVQEEVIFFLHPLTHLTLLDEGITFQHSCEQFGTANPVLHPKITILSNSAVNTSNFTKS